jgi:DNA polymerase-3 subunit epsilon
MTALREIVMDTETTGLDAQGEDRIVEIGAVELINHLPTGRVYHQYINPDRPMNAEAEAVHGLGDAFLADKPRYAEIIDAFEAFVGDATLVIHNAKFDMGFLNAERARLGRPPWPMRRAIDTVAIARRRFPGAPASLDALCRRFGVDNSAREKHGALLDSELLAEVYLELVGGRQPGFGLTGATARGATADDDAAAVALVAPQRPRPLAPLLTEKEAQAHAAFVAELGAGAMWAGGGPK